MINNILCDAHRHEAIYKLYSNASGITIKGDVWDVRDSNGNSVTIDKSAVNTKATEIFNEEQLNNLRKERNKLLQETDHWDASDTPAMSQAQIDYRQALRDITDNATSLDDVTWPTKP